MPFFIARFLGIDSMATEAEATAALLTSIRGFRTPNDGSNLDLLPFALDLESWTSLLQGVGADQWRWDQQAGRILTGSDGILESTSIRKEPARPAIAARSISAEATTARPISRGRSWRASRPRISNITAANWNSTTRVTLELNGDTGISAGVKDELNSIRGQKRIVPVFSSVTGPGNNAQYTIVQFVGIRIMEVDLTGKSTSKRVIIQPATVKARGGIPSASSNTSHFVYSPVWLVR